MTTGKTIVLTRWTFVGKVMSLLFNMLSRLVITFLSRSKCLLISWLQSPFAVILEPKKIKSVTVSIVSPSVCHEVMGPDAMTFFWMLSFKPAFSLSSFIFIKRLFNSSFFFFSAIRHFTTSAPHILFIHSSVDGYLDRFPFLALINKAAMNICGGFWGGSLVKKSPVNAGDLRDSVLFPG